jgi:hypothetical protein
VSHYQAKRIDKLRDQLADERATRQDQLREMASKHAMAAAIAESRRIDAVQLAEAARVNALLGAQKADVALAAARAEGEAKALAARVESSATALADRVEATKSASDTSVANTAVQLGARIKPLEDARYEQAGRRGGQTDVTGALKYVIGVIIGGGGLLILFLSGHVK